MSLVDLKDVSLKYPNGFVALKDLNVSIAPSEIVAIIGRSGSGKSTFLRCLNGSLAVSSGEIKVLNFDLRKATASSLKKLRTQVAFIFQHYNLVKNLDVLTNVLHGLLAQMGLFRSLLGLFSKAEKQKAREALDSVGLADKNFTRVDELSGGQQQRVAIARALVQSPQILLADEPMASLDPQLSEQIINLLVELNKKEKITLIMNLHDLSLAKKYADRIIGLREGRIVFDGSPLALNEKALAEIYEGARS